MIQVWKRVTEQGLEAVVAEILTKHPQIRKFSISGQLGAGKTTMVKLFCKHLNVKDGLSSPSFGIINHYEGKVSVVHADFYRLRSAEELLEIGFDAYVQQPGYIFVEWPEIANDYLQSENFAELKLKTDDLIHRNITLVI